MPSNELIDRVAYLLGKQVLGSRLATGGYTGAERYIFSFEDGSSAFVKAAPRPLLARWLRTEHQMYDALSGNFMLRMLGWDDDGDVPVLVLEDLSDGYWPPPWRPGDVDLVMAALEALHSTEPPPDLRPIWREEFQCWRRVALDPEPFLSLGLVSQDWLDRCLPKLLEAEKAAPFEGNEVLHLDVRSDNICLLDDRAVLVDWNNVHLGSGLFDIAAWLPSLHAEGGPAPWSVMPGAAEFASAICGYFAAWAGQPDPPFAPNVRRVQLQQLRAALPWAIRELGLPTPIDG